MLIAISILYFIVLSILLLVAIESHETDEMVLAFIWPITFTLALLIVSKKKIFSQLDELFKGRYD